MRVPGGDLVGHEQALVLGGRAIANADVDDIRSLRALAVLVGADGLDLIGRAGVRVELVDLHAVLGLVGLDDLAVVGPVVRQRDGGQRAFGLGRATRGHAAAGAAGCSSLGRAGGHERRDGDQGEEL